jgi:NitT/TauT family transport system substrate-binding protein
MAVAAAVTLFATGCGSSGGSSGASAIPALAKVNGLEKTTLNVSVVPAMDSAGFFIAQHDGLFTQEGLNVNYTPATSSETAIGKQVQGQFDITAGNYVSYIQAQASGQAKGAGGLQIIEEGSIMQQGSQVILTLPHSHITSLSQLQGRYLAVNAAGNIDNLLADSTLIDQGISKSNVHISAGVPFPSMLSALQAGFYKDATTGKTMPVNAVVVPEPFASVIEEKLGAVTVADLNQGATTQFPIEGFVVTKDWAKANPNTLTAFDTALEAGQQIADSDRAAVETAFESLSGAANGQVPAVIGSMMALNNYPLGVDEIRLQRVANVMLQFGALNKGFSVKNMLGG